MKLIFTIGNSFEVSKANIDFNIKIPYKMRTKIIELTSEQINKITSGKNGDIEAVTIYFEEGNQEDE